MSAIAFHIPGYPTDSRPARLYEASGRPSRGLLVLAHGAGAGHLGRWMVDTAAGLAACGIHVATFNFPYMEAGRKAPDRAPALEDALRRAVGAARHLVDADRVTLGGKSMGGRMATHLACADEGYAGVVAFGYPLRPPSARGAMRAPDRASHLAGLRAPLLIVQGTRDRFGDPDALRAAIPASAPVTILEVETGDHSLEVLKRSGKSQAQVNLEVWEAVARFLRGTA